MPHAGVTQKPFYSQLLREKMVACDTLLGLIGHNSRSRGGVILSPNSKEPVNLSLKSFLTLVFASGLILLFFKLFTLLLLFFLGSMMSVILNPITKRLEKFGLPRTYGIGLIAFGLLGIFVSISALLIPSVISQLASLVSALPQIRTDLLSKIPDRIEFKTVLIELLYNPKLPDTSTVMEHGMSILTGVAEAATAFSLIWIFSVYLLADGKRAFLWFSDFFSAPTRLKLTATAEETSNVIAAYAAGQFITSLGSGLFCYLTLRILHVPGALTLATLAAIFDVIPIIGFFIALAPAALLGYSISPTIGLLVVVLYSAYHAVENYLIVPVVYGSRMKISGLAVILALLAAATTGGVLLAIAILPLVASYPIIERIWLIKYLGRDVVDRHASNIEHSLPDQVKLWDEGRMDLPRASTLSNKDLAKHFRRRILIVEDDPDIRATLQDILETEGYHTFIASNGNEALMTLDSVSGIGLVLMDINMPVMDGRKLFETMKLIPELANIPVVFLSGSVHEEPIEGAAGILLKPSRLEDVISTVERLYLRGYSGSLV
jgi:predicted PurR-regulated permease PerM